MQVTVKNKWRAKHKKSLILHDSLNQNSSKRLENTRFMNTDSIIIIYTYIYTLKRDHIQKLFNACWSTRKGVCMIYFIHHQTITIFFNIKDYCYKIKETINVIVWLNIHEKGRWYIVHLRRVIAELPARVIAWRWTKFNKLVIKNETLKFYTFQSTRANDRSNFTPLFAWTAIPFRRVVSAPLHTRMYNIVLFSGNGHHITSVFCWVMGCSPEHFLFT